MMKAIDKNTFIPMPVMLVGTMHGGVPNFMPVGWVTRVNAQPPMIGIGVFKGHATAADIERNREFSICLPGKDLLARVDYCGSVSANKVSKADVFKTFTNSLKHAPMIEECQLCLECKLVQTVELPSNRFFVGEIVAAYAHPEVLTEGKPDLAKMQGMVLTMPDNHYWSVGESIGLVQQAGKGYTKPSVAAAR